MRKIITLMAALLAIAVTTSCNKKEEKAKRVIVAKPEPPKPVGTQRQDEMNLSETVSWRGNQYTINIERHPDTALPIVDDGTGEKFYDNRIDVAINRQDGSTFYKRTFTKDDFTPYLDASSVKRCALVAITALHKTDNQAISLIACVGSPDTSSDDYQVLEIRITPDGNSTIKLTTVPDHEFSDDYDDI